MKHCLLRQIIYIWRELYIFLQEVQVVEARDEHTQHAYLKMKFKKKEKRLINFKFKLTKFMVCPNKVIIKIITLCKWVSKIQVCTLQPFLNTLIIFFFFFKQNFLIFKVV